MNESMLIIAAYKLGKRTMGVALGGPSDDADVTDEQVEKEIDVLNQVAAGQLTLWNSPADTPNKWTGGPNETESEVRIQAEQLAARTVLDFYAEGGHG